MMNTFLAKSNPVETIMEHTDELLIQYESLNSIYPHIPYVDWKLLEIACQYHDVGKMNTKFQNKIRRAIGLEELEDELEDTEEIHHGYLSVAFLPFKQLKKDLDKDKLRILCQAIYYHHDRGKQDFPKISETIKKDLTKHIQEFTYLHINENELNTKYDKYVRNRICPIEYDLEVNAAYVVTKGLLNRIDYAASAHVPVEIANVDLFDKTMTYIEGMGKPNDLQEYMMRNQNENVIALASTGTGKTEAALLWIGNNKGFFTLPLQISNNAIYDRVKEKIKFEHVGLLHANMLSEYLKRADEHLEMDYVVQTQKFSLPLTISTLDQLVDFVFKYAGYEMKLATLAYSKLVVDEIQMYSPDFVAYLLLALKQITELKGKFAIVTATFPPVFKHFMEDLKIPFEEPKVFLKLNARGESMKRHSIKVLNEDIHINHILENVENRKILVIVNTIKKAQELYNELDKMDIGVPIQLLHSRFIKKDRAEKEAAILEMGDRKSTESGIWITTQIVEASLDIDFDVLYTELSEINGLFQRMGRVYRQRELENNEPNVFVYIGNEFTSGIDESKNSIVDPIIFHRSKSSLQIYSGVLDEETKMKLIDEVYDVEGLKNSNYYKTIQQTILEFKDITAYEIKKEDIRLRDIHTETIIPTTVFQENEAILEEIKERYNKISKKQRALRKRENLTDTERKSLQNEYKLAKIQLKDELMLYTVSIPLYMFRKATKDKLVTNIVELDKWLNIPVVNYQYDNEWGIRYIVEEESFFF